MKNKLLTTAAVTLLSLSALNGAIILHESFDYPAGNLSGNNGSTGFSGAWATGTATSSPNQGSGASLAVNAIGLSYTDFVSSGGSVQDTAATAFQNNRSYTDPTGWGVDGNSFWFSALVQQTTSGPMHLRFGTSATNGASGGFGFLYNDGNTNTVYARIGASAGPATAAGAGFSATNVNLIVGRVSFSDTLDADNVSIWLNPSVLATDVTSLNSSALTTSTATGNITISGSLLHIHSNGTTVGSFDEIRLGNNLSDVLVAVPEPSAYAALLALLATAFGFIRRRK